MWMLMMFSWLPHRREAGDTESRVKGPRSEDPEGERNEFRDTKCISFTFS